MNIFSIYNPLRAISFAYFRRRPVVASVEESVDLGHSTEHEGYRGDGELRLRKLVAVDGKVTEAGTYCADSRGHALPYKPNIIGSRIDVSG